MTITETARHITKELKTMYQEGEASTIAGWVLEYLTGKDQLEIASAKQTLLTTEQKEKLEPILNRLLQQEPVQYVLNESWFCGLRFYVDKNVLIPRPETEELVDWIITNCKFPVDELKILDIGSGSGCIPVTLKRRLKKAEVWSCDISKEALAVAKKNTAALGTDVNFIQLDFLNSAAWVQLPPFDIIVSNPPYVPQKDKQTMQPNVLNYEPATALFVPENDPLIFYKAIADFGKEKLTKRGMIYMEIHEDIGKVVSKLFQSNGYSTEIKKDMQGKERMVKAVLSLESGVVSREL